MQGRVTTKWEYLESQGIPQPKTIGDDNMLKVIYVFEVSTIETKHLKNGKMRKEFTDRDTAVTFAKHWRKHNKWYGTLNATALIHCEVR